MIAKKKLTLSIRKDLNRRLDLEAVIEEGDRSSIVDALVKAKVELPDDWRTFAAADPGPSPSPDGLTPGRQQPAAVARGKTTLYVSAETAMRLGLYSQLT